LASSSCDAVQGFPRINQNDPKEFNKSQPSLQASFRVHNSKYIKNVKISEVRFVTNVPCSTNYVMLSTSLTRSNIHSMNNLG
jgi:hypothetical protein